MTDVHDQNLLVVRKRGQGKIRAALARGELSIRPGDQSLLVTIMRWLNNGGLEQEEVAAMLWQPIQECSWPDFQDRP
jgi:hypothetical protein